MQKENKGQKLQQMIAEVRKLKLAQTFYVFQYKKKSYVCSFTLLKFSFYLFRKNKPHILTLIRINWIHSSHISATFRVRGHKASSTCRWLVQASHPSKHREGLGAAAHTALKQQHIIPGFTRLLLCCIINSPQSWTHQRPSNSGSHSVNYLFRQP